MALSRPWDETLVDQLDDEGVWLLIEGDQPTARRSLGAAVETVGDERAEVVEYVHTPAGLAAFVKAYTVDDDAPAVFFDALETALQKAPGSFTVRQTERIGFPAWVADVQPTAAVFSAWRLPRPIEFPARPAWMPTTEATDAMLTALRRWIDSGDGTEVMAMRGADTRVPPDHVEAMDLIADDVHRRISGLCFRYSTEHRTGRYVAVYPGGHSVIRSEGDGRPWPDLADPCRTFLIDTAHHVDTAFVLDGRRFSLWNQVHTLRRPPALASVDVTLGWHLLDRYVLDVFGMQVLTSRHLDRTSDLTSWVTTDLGDDRHLVEARDLEPWFSEPKPDEAILTTARRDFGAALLTSDVVAADPAPWQAN